MTPSSIIGFGLSFASVGTAIVWLVWLSAKFALDILETYDKWKSRRYHR